MLRRWPPSWRRAVSDHIGDCGGEHSTVLWVATARVASRVASFTCITSVGQSRTRKWSTRVLLKNLTKLRL